MRLKKWDFVVFLVPVMIAVLSTVFVFSNGDERIARIEIDGTVIQTVDLNSTPNLELDITPEYHNKIVVKGGKIGILSADCKDNTCVRTGFIDTPGQSIVCVPSRLVITVTGGDTDE